MEIAHLFSHLACVPIILCLLLTLVLNVYNPFQHNVHLRENGEKARGWSRSTVSLLKHHHSQRRDGHERANGSGCGTARRVASRPPKLPNPFSAVLLRVAVQHFAPEPALGNADAVVQARHRREVEHHEYLVAAGPPLPQVADDARILVAEVHPLEACVVEIELIQRRLASIEPVQVPSPTATGRSETGTAEGAIRRSIRGSTRPTGRSLRP